MGIRELVQAVVADCLEQGETVPVPFSEQEFKGKVHVRMSSSLHRSLTVEAAEEGVSLNAHLTTKLARGL